MLLQNVRACTAGLCSRNKANNRFPGTLSNWPAALSSVRRQAQSGPLNAMATKRLWVDCDAGVDDVQALMLALRHPCTAVEGVSIVRGNVGVSQGALNVSRVLLTSPCRVPVFKGADATLASDVKPLTEYYGRDGLGDVPDVQPTPIDAAQANTIHDQNAIDALVEAANRWQGKLWVAALGPLTNIALACQRHPAFPAQLAGLYILGGAEGEGNVTATAEYNFHQDPEAADVVMRSFSRTTNCHLVTWQACKAHLLPWHEVEALQKLAQQQQPTDGAGACLEGQAVDRAAFFTGIMAPFLDAWRQESPNGLILGDTLAVAAILGETADGTPVVRESVRATCTIDLSPERRGTSVITRLAGNSLHPSSGTGAAAPSAAEAVGTPASSVTQPVSLPGAMAQGSATDGRPLAESLTVTGAGSGHINVVTSLDMAAIQCLIRDSLVQ